MEASARSPFRYGVCGIVVNKGLSALRPDLDEISTIRGMDKQTREGAFSREQGLFSARTGNFFRRNRELIRRLRASAPNAPSLSKRRSL
jgi:hypothetical protein